MHVVYGLVGLKTHAKVLLVVRQESDGIRRYCHVGTGNYNPKTATALRGHRAPLGRSRPRRRPHRSLQPPHRLQPPGHVPQARRRALAPAPRDRRTYRAPGRARPRGPDHLQDEQPRRSRPHRFALRRRAARRRDRPHRARHLLPPAPGQGPVGGHPRAVDPRALPRALAGLPVRGRPGIRRVPHRLRRPDAPEPRPPGRDPRPGHRSPAAGAPRAR